MNNFKIVKNTQWKEVEINGEMKEIPVDWNMKKVEQLTICLDSKRKALNQSERNLKKGSVPYWGANSIVDYVRDYLIDEDVILLGEDAAPFYDKSKKVSFISKGKIWPNNHIHVLKPLSNIIDSYYLMTSLNIIKYEKIIGVESRPKLTQKMMNSIDVLLPSISQQSSIANILSHQESIINDMETLVEKYETRLRYLSEELLSGRLRVKEVAGKNVFYKNTEWKEVEINGEMKEIPVDWEVRKFRDEIKFSMGSTPKKEKNNYKGDLPWITISNLGERFISSYTAKILKSKGIRIFPAGTLLGSFKMSVGKFGFISDESSINEAIIGIRPSDTKNNLDYLYYYLPKIFKDNAELNGQGLALLNQEKINNLDIIIPKVSIQLNIVKVIFTQNDLLEQQKSLLKKEKNKFIFLLNNLLSGNYLIGTIA